VDAAGRVAGTATDDEGGPPGPGRAWTSRWAQARRRRMQHIATRIVRGAVCRAMRVFLREGRTAPDVTGVLPGEGSATTM